MSFISDIRKKIGHDKVFMPCATAVIIQNNQILLQKRTDDNTWAIHGGSIEFDETFLEALNRELGEELNIIPLNPEFIDIYSGRDCYHVYPNGDEIYSINASYLVMDYVGELRPDQEEVAEVQWFPLDKLPSNILDVDVKVIHDGIQKYLSKVDRL